MFHVGIDVMNTCDCLIGIQRNVPFRRLGTGLIITFMLLFLTYTQAIDTDITCTDLCRNDPSPTEVTSSTRYVSKGMPMETPKDRRERMPEE